MASLNSPFDQSEHITPPTNDPYADMLGQRYLVPDEDNVNGTNVKNSAAMREVMLVRNNPSGSALDAGMCLHFTAGYYNQRVDAATSGHAIRGYVPYSIRGNQTNTIPAGDYFLMVIDGPRKAGTDGNAITAGDLVIVGGTTGYVKTDNASPTANVSVRGGTATLDAGARGTGSQVFVSLIGRCDV